MSSSNTGSLRFSLSTLFLAITIIAVCLGIGRYNEALGVIAVFVSTLAIVRTVSAIGQQEEQGIAVDSSRKVKILLLSVGIVTGIIAVFVAVLFFGIGISVAIIYLVAAVGGWQDGIFLISPMAVMFSYVVAVLVSGAVAHRYW